MRVRDLPKLHHEDPTGFWQLVRTGKSLPKPGEQILYVYDIRGTSAELRHGLLMNIAKGNPYQLTDGVPTKLPPGVQALHAELFRLPTEGFKPETHVGVVDQVGFDEIMQEHWISVRSGASVWSKHHASEHIVHWAPLPAPINTYTPREGDLADLYYTDGLYVREEREACEAQAALEQPGQ